MDEAERGGVRRLEARRGDANARRCKCEAMQMRGEARRGEARRAKTIKCDARGGEERGGEAGQGGARKRRSGARQDEGCQAE